MKYYAIIVAGGSGNRMNSEIPKQFLLLNNKPVLLYSMEAFHHSGLQPEIILVLNAAYYGYWEDICKKYNLNIPHKLVAGGETRFASVQHGLEAVKEESVVAIHDAARPLVSRELIRRAFFEAGEKGTAVAGVNSSDSVRQVQDDTSVALDRRSIYLIQTPQAFQSGILKKAYEQPYQTGFTDDASVVERTGVKINVIPGYPSNIKITYSGDIGIAQFFLKEALL